MALERADPALFRTDDRDRLALDHRLHGVDFGRRYLGGAGEIRAPFADFRLEAELRVDRLDLVDQLFGLELVRAEQLLQILLFFGQRRMLVADFHLLQLAQGAQAHVEDGFRLIVGELERLHQFRLRLVLRRG